MVGSRSRRRRRGRKKIQWNGGIVAGPMHPRTTSASPWNTLYHVMNSSITVSGVLDCTLQTIRKSVVSELGLEAETVLDLRLFRVDVWTSPSAANSDRNFIILAPVSYNTSDIDGQSPNIDWFESWGTAAQPAHVHYVWPRSISLQVLPYEDEGVVLFRMGVKKGQRFIIRLHLEWRFSNPDPRPSGASVGIMSSIREHWHHKVSSSRNDGPERSLSSLGFRHSRNEL